MQDTITTTEKDSFGTWAGDGFDEIDAAAAGFWTGVTGNAVEGYQYGSATSGQFDNVEGGGASDELGDAAEDAVENTAPAWLRWILNHQEETAVVVVLLILLVAAKPYAEIGAAAAGGTG